MKFSQVLKLESQILFSIQPANIQLSLLSTQGMLNMRVLVFFQLIGFARLSSCSNYIIKPWLHLNDSIIAELNQKDGIKSVNHCQDKALIIFRFKYERRI